MRKLILLVAVIVLVSCEKEPKECNCYKQYQMEDWQTGQWIDTYTEPSEETNCNANGSVVYTNSQVRSKMVCQ